MRGKIPIALLADGKLTGRRLGRKPNVADLAEAKAILDWPGPDSQKVAVWFIRKLAERELSADAHDSLTLTR